MNGIYTVDFVIDGRCNLVSETGLLTIGPRFGGAIDDAARYFKDAYDRVSSHDLANLAYPIIHGC